MTSTLKRAYRRSFPKYGISAPVVVHQMGQVGSRSVEAGLLRLRLGVPVHHCHFLGKFDHFEDFFRRTMAEPGPNLECVREGRNLLEQIERAPEPWNVVSLVRDPIARDVSRFFFDLDRFKPEYRDRFHRGDVTVDELHSLYLEQIDRARNDPDFEVRWEFFDSQIKRPLGIDIYDEPFPVDQGYRIVEGAQARLLLIRLEDLDRQAGEAFGRFLGIPDFQPDYTNGAEAMPYAELHSRFKREADLPAEVLDWLADVPWVHHCYSPQEIQSFKQRWTRS